jgi:hypothetical protein
MGQKVTAWPKKRQKNISDKLEGPIDAKGDVFGEQ